jgi:hypothetical protein
MQQHEGSLLFMHRCTTMNGLWFYAWKLYSTQLSIIHVLHHHATNGCNCNILSYDFKEIHHTIVSFLALTKLDSRKATHRWQLAWAHVKMTLNINTVNVVSPCNYNRTMLDPKCRQSHEDPLAATWQPTYRGHWLWSRATNAWWQDHTP